MATRACRTEVAQIESTHDIKVVTWSCTWPISSILPPMLFEVFDGSKTSIQYYELSSRSIKFVEEIFSWWVTWQVRYPAWVLEQGYIANFSHLEPNLTIKAECGSTLPWHIFSNVLVFLALIHPMTFHTVYLHICSSVVRSTRGATLVRTYNLHTYPHSVLHWRSS